VGLLEAIQIVEDQAARAAGLPGAWGEDETPVGHPQGLGVLAFGQVDPLQRHHVALEEPPVGEGKQLFGLEEHPLPAEVEIDAVTGLVEAEELAVGGVDEVALTEPGAREEQVPGKLINLRGRRRRVARSPKRRARVTGQPLRPARTLCGSMYSIPGEPFGACVKPSSWKKSLLKARIF